jgi:hypothetical protein
VTLHFYLLNKTAIQMTVSLLVEALRYNPKGRVSISNGVMGFLH